jgi:flagellar biosynthesis protein FliR
VNLSLDMILARALPIGLRIAGLATFAPFFGAQSVPVRVKAAFTIPFTVLMYFVAPPTSISLSAANIFSVCLKEAAVGLLTGLALQIVFEGFQIAGQLAGMQHGFSMASIIDPQTNIDTPVLSTYANIVAIFIFLQLNVHHWIVRGLIKSFDYLPVGSAKFTALDVKEVFHMAGGMWMVAIQIAAPVILATMVVDIALGFLSKASPQLPAMMLGMSIKSLVGYATMAAVVGFWPSLLEKYCLNGLAWSERFFQLAR